jgi:SAM-dependent methyltransferase
VSFDSQAGTYDQAFGRSPTGRLFRFHLTERVMSETRPPARVLDVGCGTGDDAIWLAANGYSVHGVDASPGMIETAKAKAAISKSTATFASVSVQELSARCGGFDVVMSNFGALNCVPLSTWTGILPGLLAPSGRGHVVLMGRRPLPESVRRGFATSNRGEVAEVRVGSSMMRVEYPSIAAVRKALSTSASVTRTEALGCLVPGPGYQGFTERHAILVGILAMGECIVRLGPFFKGRGDHTLFEFQR